MIDPLRPVAREAGNAILEIYSTEFSVDYKDDRSPLTQADCASHRIVVDALRESFPQIPVISEESGRQIEYEERRGWGRFWLVDPLDGTKEFVKKNGEFTVNVALIEDGFPVFGLIYVPVTGVLYWAERGAGAWRETGEGVASERVRSRRVESGDDLVVVQSRSHPSGELEAYLQTLRVRESISAGSSLKFCLVAEGRGDCYPRLGPTMEWDTAAGQAIVEAAGGRVTRVEGNRLEYNKPSLKNPHFIVKGAGVE